MPAWRAGMPQKARGGEAPGVAGQGRRAPTTAKSVPVGRRCHGTAVQTQSDLCRHICKQLRHAGAGVRKWDSLSLLLSSWGGVLNHKSLRVQWELIVVIIPFPLSLFLFLSLSVTMTSVSGLRWRISLLNSLVFVCVYMCTLSLSPSLSSCLDLKSHSLLSLSLSLSIYPAHCLVAPLSQLKHAPYHVTGTYHFPPRTGGRRSLVSQRQIRRCIIRAPDGSTTHSAPLCALAHPGNLPDDPCRG